MMKCPGCGADVDGSEKFCEYCAATLPVQLRPEPKQTGASENSGKKPRPKYGIIAAVGIISLAIGGCAAWYIPKKAPDVPVQIEEPAESEAEQSDDSETAETALDRRTPIDAVIRRIEKRSLKNYDYHSISGDETEIIIHVAGNGVASEVDFAKASGDAGTYASWARLKQNMISLCKSARDLLDAYGYSDTAVEISLVSDRNYDTVLLTVRNDVVICDVLAQCKSAG